MAAAKNSACTSLQQSCQQGSRADGDQAIRWRRHDRCFLNRLVEAFGFGVPQLTHPCSGCNRFVRELVSNIGQFARLALSDATELILKKATEAFGLGALKHLNQCAQFDALGVRLDFLRFIRKFVDSTREDDRLVCRTDPGDFRMRDWRWRSAQGTRRSTAAPSGSGPRVQW